MDWDVFVCHASEDKEAVARPLRDALAKRGVSVWLDETEVKLGDSLRQAIEAGLSKSRYGIVILSRAFFATHKTWTQRELSAMVSREESGQKVILPLWHDVDAPFVREHAPLLADRYAARIDQGFESVVDQIVDVVSPTPHLGLRSYAESITSRWPLPSVDVRSLGTLEVRMDGETVPNANFASIRAQELLLLFLNSKQGVTKEEAVAAIYPEIFADKANPAFHTNLHRIRKALYHDCVVKQSGKYALNPSGNFSWDVLTFKGAAVEALNKREGPELRVARLQRAQALYKGPLDESFTNPWADGLRQHLALLASLVTQALQSSPE